MFMHQIMIAIKQLVASYATWDPTQSLNMALSGGNLTATNTTSGTTRSTVGKSSGKWYWELTNFSAVSMVGIVKSTDPYAALTYLGQTAISYGYWQAGQIYNNGGTLGTFAGINPGDIVSFKLDMDAGTCEILRNSGSIYTITGLTGTWHAGCGINGTGLQCTANFGATAFSYAVPSGYNSGLYT
jgi:hypothetical protein